MLRVMIAHMKVVMLLMKKTKRYNNRYLVDKSGNVYYRNRNNELVKKKFRKDKDGYLITSAIDDKKGIETTVRVHRLVAECYIPNPQNKPIVHHINNIKDDNRVENLMWVTVSENTKFAYVDKRLISPNITPIELYIDDVLYGTYSSIKKVTQLLGFNRNHIDILRNSDNKYGLYVKELIHRKGDMSFVPTNKNILNSDVDLGTLNPIKLGDKWYKNIKDFSERERITYSKAQYVINKKRQYKNIDITKEKIMNFLIENDYITLNI